jgi:type VI secretion system protein VasD
MLQYVRSTQKEGGMPGHSMPVEASPRLYARRIVSLSLGVLLTLGGCSKPEPPPPPPSPPPPPPPTTVSVTIKTAPDTNLTPDGQGAPVVIRIYQLASRSSFDAAEFYRLYNGDAATLGADLVKKEEFLLAPASSRTVSIEPADTVHAIGIFAAYSDFQKVTWRGVANVPPHETTTVTVGADRSGVTLAVTSAKPADH